MAPAQSSCPGVATFSRRDVLRFGAAGVAALGAGGVLLGCTPGAAPSGEAASGPPRRGGRLRIGINGGSAKDLVDAHTPKVSTDTVRLIQLYDPLATYDSDNRIQLAMAESIEPSADGKTWTVRLRAGLEFHNGKTITAEDVAFSLARITDKSVGAFGALQFPGLDRNAITVVDPRTVKLTFANRTATVLDALAQYYNSIVPVDYDPKSPIGSGPFKMGTFTPGEQSAFQRHPNYWRDGEPYLDEIVIIDFPDDTARINALLGGSVDAVNQLPLGQISGVRGNRALRVLEAETGAWIPFTMRADQAPFNDVRVRQAFRLLVDRKQMIQQVLSGHGAVGNDMYGRFDPCYATELPQRERDVDRAKSFLAAAGATGLKVELVTSAAVAAGAVEAAQVFATQAKEGGVDVQVRKVDAATLFGDNFLKWSFTQDFWVTRPYLLQAAISQMPGAQYDATHWNDPEWVALVNEATGTLDEGKRCDLIGEAQKIEYERGSLIVWGFPNQVDGYSAKMQGLVPDKGGLPLSGYRFRKVWLAG